MTIDPMDYSDVSGHRNGLGAVDGTGPGSPGKSKRQITDELLDAAIAEADGGYDLAFELEKQRLQGLGLNF